MRAVRLGNDPVGSGSAPRAEAERGHGHRHTAPGQHEHEFEPQHGLPEPLPAGETILWQGAPDWKTLAVHRFHVRKLAIYFALMLAARIVSVWSDGQPLAAALSGTLPLMLLSLLAVGGMTLIAWMSARNTVYTLTDKRVVMRIGIVLTLTLNLPLRRMSGAALALLGPARSGFGDVALQLHGPDRIAFLHLWPHARRWRFARPEPTLLCLPDAAAVAAQLTAAWRAAEAPAVAALPGTVAAAVGVTAGVPATAVTAAASEPVSSALLAEPPAHLGSALSR